MVGFDIGPNTKNVLVVMSSPGVELTKGYDGQSGATASPSASGDFESSSAPPQPPPPPASTSNSEYFSWSNSIFRQEIGN